VSYFTDPRRCLPAQPGNAGPRFQFYVLVGYWHCNGALTAMWWLQRIVFTLIVLAAVVGPASAAERLALLIGNQGYSGNVQPLKSPFNDIATVGKALTSVGFKVTTLEDAGRRQMLSAVKTFAAKLAKGGPDVVSFLYYSGHGVARPEDRENYLIPVDLKDTSSTDFWFDAVKLDDILGELERAAPFAAHFVVFDACRNELKLPYKSTVKGFEPVVERSGMFIAFATALGAVALDEGKVSGSSGPYASVLAAELMKPGQDHLHLFQAVKEGVFASTKRQQVPWERNGLLKLIYFGGEATASKPDTPASLSEAGEAWTLVKDTTRISTLDAFIGRFGETFYGDLAKARLIDLKQQAEAAQQAADAAQKKSEEEASVKAEAERQRLVMLQQQENEKRRSEAEATEQVMTTSEPVKVAALPKIEKPESLVSFDGAWTITRVGKGSCGRGRIYSFPVIVRNGRVNGGSGREDISGTVSASGSFVFRGKGQDGRSNVYSGAFRGASGRGTFRHPECAGTFTAKRG
jgi:uncharacterized caspase-like protein